MASNSTTHIGLFHYAKVSANGQMFDRTKAVVKLNGETREQVYIVENGHISRKSNSHLLLESNSVVKEGQIMGNVQGCYVLLPTHGGEIRRAYVVWDSEDIPKATKTGVYAVKSEFPSTNQKLLGTINVPDNKGNSVYWLLR